MTELELKAVPIFRIGNVPKAKLFYVDFLGLTVDWEHYYEPGAPVYMQVSRAGLILQLSENSRFNFGNIIYIDTRRIEQLWSELRERSSAWDIPPVSASPWSTKQMEIEDPFGNLLRFHEAEA